MRQIKVGLCGFTVGMAQYARHFPVVEVQQTFYQPPEDETLRRWRANAPPDFEFTLKAWQLITHTSTSSTYRRMRRPLTAHERDGLGAFRNTPIVDEGWHRTVECAHILSATAILFQSPASFRPSDEHIENLHAFFGRIKRPEGIRLMWEPRGPWPEQQVARLCAELALVHVVDPFVTDAQTRSPTYFRLHGVTGSRHVYSDEELRWLMTRIPVEGDVYVMFNNLPRVGDAKRFINLIEADVNRRVDLASSRDRRRELTE
ncbi:MAG TPA: DUF72 domain-containing protein [Burkholderiaceae bacterium]|nr:DUF72 domain-containing protein [Burkholderiaceae bacterium]